MLTTRKNCQILFVLEKRNYINQNIATLIDTDGSTITDRKRILDKQHAVHSDLYSTKSVKGYKDSEFSERILRYIMWRSKYLNNAMIQLLIEEDVNSSITNMSFLKWFEKTLGRVPKLAFFSKRSFPCIYLGVWSSQNNAIFM